MYGIKQESGDKKEEGVYVLKVIRNIKKYQLLMRPESKICDKSNMKKTVIKISAWIIIVIIVACLALVLIFNHIVVCNAKGKAFSDIDSIKYNKVGLLLGTTPQARITKVKNYFFVYRIDAAEELYKAGKIKQILISGDENSLDGINETECMRDSLVARGVPASDIILDGKGYRTINSVINANKVFGLKSFTIISQEFHNERAIYQAEHLGLDVENLQGYNAKMPKSRRAFLTTIREYFARVKMFIDLCMTDMESITNLSGGIKQIEDPITTDSFTIVYRQPVNGYKVTAVAKLAESDVDIISADLTFTKGGKPFTLHTQCFGDTLFCKGRLDFQSENPELFRKYRGKTVEADYHMSKNEGQLMPIYTPFFFMDLDFDGIEELVIVHNSMAVRYHDGYDVYRIVEGRPVLIDYPPYHDNMECWDFGMTDYPKFDYKKKTISCPYPEGEMKYAGRVI